MQNIFCSGALAACSSSCCCRN